MESHTKFIEEFEYGCGLPQQSSSSKGPQNFYNLDPLMADSKHGIPASDYYPLEPPTNACSSICNFFVDDRADGWHEKLQPWGVMDYSQNAWGEPVDQERSHALDFPHMEPMNFQAPDAMSCVSGCSERHDRKARVSKKRMQMTSNGGMQQKSHVGRGQWTVDEDRILTFLVEQWGVKKWAEIAKLLNGRVGKQCRERWYNHLRPNIKKDDWSEEEDMVLVAFHRMVGNRWSEIAKKLPGRTENSIKNHWNTSKRRQLAGSKSRSYKTPNPSSVLQKYITSITQQRAAAGNQSNQTHAASPPKDYSPKWNQSAPDYNLDNIIDLPAESTSFCGSNGGLLVDDDMPATSITMTWTGENHMETEVASKGERFMHYENMKREVDLLEMITQRNDKK